MLAQRHGEGVRYSDSRRGRDEFLVAGDSGHGLRSYRRSGSAGLHECAASRFRGGARMAGRSRRPRRALMFLLLCRERLGNELGMDSS